MSADVPGTRRLSYRFRLYPTEAQKEAIQANIDACRYIYNRLLRMRIDSYQATKQTLRVHALAPGADPSSERPEWLRDEDGEWVYEEVPNPDYDPEAKPLTKFDCSKLVSAIKSQTVSEDGRFFLKEADSTALIYANNNLDAAYQAFFRRVKQGGKPGFPRFKSRKNPMRAYKTAGAVISRRDGEGWEKLKSLSDADGKWTHVYLPKVGFVRAKIHRMPQGEQVSCAVRAEADGTYYAVINVKNAPMPDAASPAAGPVGITFGVSHWAVDSDGEVRDLPDTSDLERRLAREKRKLSRRKGAKKGEAKSANYEKQRMKVARLEAKIRRKREYAVHGFTNELSKTREAVASREMASKDMMERDTRAVEKLPRKARRSINKGIAEGSFAEVNRQLAYKCAWRGVPFALVPSTTATAQTCSACGHVEKAVADDLRPRWRCPECGTVHDRKGNGAQNVLEEGMRLLAEAKE